ncbi:hypothetical protein CFP65_6949 [Kitasatospora sp. MMS16-BH015]|uniref:hypothetical protein n=1 Tax=Kitasatospora sp. MMS16-BH015 TaxID=2018025 RepID=UPI000CA32CEA|nr:hypothetical protein [Kitasatospora sp. MMS16-BH015]AUG81564.1 hypothetical protein CFP65_6949 [Kitasatospora sp. MMS16-BH015]
MSIRAWAGYALVRLPLAVAVAALGIAGVAHQAVLRGLEAGIAVTALTSLFGRRAIASPAYANLYVSPAPDHWVALHVAPSCSLGLILPALCAPTVVLLILRPMRPWAPLMALGSATAVFAVCNLARITGLALVCSRWGFDGPFHTAHAWAGTFVTIAACAVAVAAYLHCLSRGRRLTPRGTNRP